MVFYMKKNKGFTLIEVMIVVAIIGILAAIAYPSYDEYVKRGNRAEGQAFLNEVAARQERYFSQNNAYVTSVDDISKLGLSESSSETGKYTLSIGKDKDNDYTLTANQQFNDTKCGNLTLNAIGDKGANGKTTANSADREFVMSCWR